MSRQPAVLAGAVTVAFAAAFAFALVTSTAVPPTTLVPDDEIEFEYAERKVAAVAGAVERERVIESRVLEIDGGGLARLLVARGLEVSDSELQVDDGSLHRLRALVKETGFMEITPASFLAEERPPEYDLYTLGVRLNGVQKDVRWTSNSTENFVPPLVVAIQHELDAVRAGLE